MKILLQAFVCASVLFLAACAGGGKSPKTEYTMEESTSNGYTYKYVLNDPLNTRIYTLSNGLEVYLSDYKASPRIYTAIAVRAGGKFDPARYTGLAHYLEHMVFKGTSDFGTLDWEKEKVLLDSITRMFDYYGTLTDPEERKAYYAQIDKVSSETAKYSVANEYDNMLSSMGAKGTNAYTSSDRTVYINDIPSNQLDAWLEVEANRFQKLVPRLFHTELETVYEEKNRTLDSDGWTVFQTLQAKLFPNHPYGTQTVIGTIEHLKNPSISEIMKYFNTYYRPNNVAICLSGDLDYDKTISLIEKYFGKWEPNNELSEWISPTEEPPAVPIEEDILGPEEERVVIGFLQPGEGKKNYATAVLVDRILSNSQAGLIDLNLVQTQKVLSAFSSLYENDDYSIGILVGSPREGQTLEEVRDLLLEQVELLRKGEFEDWLIDAISSDYEKDQLSVYENNRIRASVLVQVATNPSLSLSGYLNIAEQMRNTTKEEVIAYVNENFQSYVLINKREGERDIPKIEKPQITKVTLNEGKRSSFAEGILSREPVEVQPVFLDYEKSIQTTSAKNGKLPVHYIKNDENERFSLYYYSDLNNRHDPKAQIALRYLDYLSPEGMSVEDFKKELFKLGCEFGANVNTIRSYIYIRGLSRSAEQAIDLVERLLASPAADPEALQKLVAGIQKERENAMQDRASIRDRLFSYALYGPRSPITNVLSSEQLSTLTPEELIDIIRNFSRTEHRVLYYGPVEQREIVQLIEQYHQTPESFEPLSEEIVFEIQEITEPKVYWTHYNMVQSEIIFSTRGEVYSPEKAARMRLYNTTFGSGMSSILFRQLREAQGLAYSTSARYRGAPRAGEYDSFFGYIGTQADKQTEAIPAMLNLIRDFPLNEKAFEVARKSVLNRIRNERIMRENVFFSYLDAKRRGLDYDLRRKVFEETKKMTPEDIRNFQEEDIKDKKFAISLLGNKERINFNDLKKYGSIQEISLKELFGYDVQLKAVVP